MTRTLTLVTEHSVVLVARALYYATAIPAALTFLGCLLAPEAMIQAGRILASLIADPSSLKILAIAWAGVALVIALITRPSLSVGVCFDVRPNLNSSRMAAALEKEAAEIRAPSAFMPCPPQKQ